MKTLSLDLPAMYGDHHVIDVRRLLFEMPGIEEVYASSSFRVLEVAFDDKKVTEEQIKTSLEDAGYLGELPIQTEINIAASEPSDSPRFFRHTALYEDTLKTMSFAQKVGYQGRPLWPCPGMGPLEPQEMVD
jgi:copper chaperone CopZ